MFPIGQRCLEKQLWKGLSLKKNMQKIRQMKTLNLIKNRGIPEVIYIKKRGKNIIK